MAATEVKIAVPGNHLMVALLGQRDELLRLVEAAYPDASIVVRGNEISVGGDGADLAARTLEELVRLVQSGHRLDAGAVRRAIAMVQADERPSEILSAEVLRAPGGRVVRPKSSGQKRYVEAIRRNVITFGIGPAGTGKSWLAVASAVQALSDKQVDRIILTRPAVEAGERLGFLPGDLMAKVDPYLRPLYDALHDMVGLEAAQKMLERGTVEVAPLAFMRGRAQPVDRRVLTPWGWRAIGSLEVGDQVVGSDGRPTLVLGVYRQGRRDVYTVRAQDGAETVCCGEHLWHVFTPEDRRRGKRGRVLRTDEMIGRLRRNHQHRFELPVVSAPVEFEPRPVPMDPYALGSEVAAVASTYATQLPPIREGLVRGGGPNPTTGGRELLLDEVRSETRFIPLEHLLNSVDVRLAVLQGLLDNDGEPVSTPAHGGRIQYATCSERLHDDVVFLVRSLGGVAYSPDDYCVDIRLPAGIEPFRLERKRARYEAFGAGRPMRFIDRIEPAGEAETVCIQVAAADSLYVTDDFLVTHNTLNSSFIICDEAQNTSPEQMKMFLTRIGFGSRAVVTGDVTQVDVQGGRSGLAGLERILTGIEGLEWVHLTSSDVVRHRIVQEIVDAYERAGAEEHAERRRS